MIKKYLAAIAVMFPMFAVAACPWLYPNNTPIVVSGAVELCNDQYVAVYDPVNRAVLFTSEIVQPDGHTVKRQNSFRRDSRIANGPSPSEYEFSNYDKGHMAPADDATSDAQMRQSMLMTNATPQNPKLNRGRWKSVETTARKMISKSGQPTHVLTLAIYEKHPQMMGNIPIPKAYAKVVYLNTGVDITYTNNTPTGTLTHISPDQLGKLIQYAKIPR